MPFPSGSVSFRQFAVLGKSPPSPHEWFLDRMDSYAFSDDIVEEVMYGWAGGGHIYDAAFSFEHNVFSECLFFALRIDTHRPPADVVRAHRSIQEDALAASNPSWFLSKAQKREAREAVQVEMEAQQKAGKFRRSRAIPILWDVPAGLLLAQVSGDNVAKLAEIFERSFQLELRPMTAGVIATVEAAEAGLSRALEDVRPSAFADPPDAGMTPEYPWVARTADPRRYLGNEFLLWAIWRSRSRENDNPWLFDRKLELECAYGATGRHVVTGTAPDRLAEVHQAMRSGKVPRRASMTAVFGKEEYQLTLDPEAFAFAGVKLPEVEEAETPRALFEARIAHLRELIQSMNLAYCRFLRDRLSVRWPAFRDEIIEWINKTTH